MRTADFVIGGVEIVVLLFNVCVQSLCNVLLLLLCYNTRSCSYFFVEECRSIWSEGFAQYRQVGRCSELL